MGFTLQEAQEPQLRPPKMVLGDGSGRPGTPLLSSAQMQPQHPSSTPMIRQEKAMLLRAATARPRPKPIFKNQKDQAFLDVFSLEEEHDQLFVSQQDKKGP